MSGLRERGYQLNAPACRVPQRQASERGELRQRRCGRQRGHREQHLPQPPQTSEGQLLQSLYHDSPSRDLAALIKKLAQVAAQDKRYKLQPGAEWGWETQQAWQESHSPKSLNS